MKLLLVGDMAATGFGTVTMDLGRALLARGVDVRFVSVFDHELPEPFASRTALIGGFWLSSDEEGGEHFRRMFTGGGFEDGWAPDAALITGDPGSLIGNPVLAVLPPDFPAWHYAPIEGIDLPPAWLTIWHVAKPIAMCEFGADEIAKLTGERPPVVYHGVDTDTFREASALRPLIVDHKAIRSKAEAKAFFGRPADRTLLLRTDAYWPRKCYPSMLRAIMPVLAARPEVDLLIHCAFRGPGGDIRVELSKYGELSKRVLLTGAGGGYVGGKMPREHLAALYNAADLYVSSSPEGFGLTIAEALACGTPAVGLDFSSVPEVIGPAGQVVPVGNHVDSIYSLLWATPNEEAMAEAVAFLATHKHRREQLGMLGPMHVKSKFQWSQAAAQFEAILSGAQSQEAAA